MRHNKSEANLKIHFMGGKDDEEEPILDNFQAIYDKIQKASSLLRTKSSERKKSAIRQYQRSSKRSNNLYNQYNGMSSSKVKF